MQNAVLPEPSKGVGSCLHYSVSESLSQGGRGVITDRSEGGSHCYCCCWPSVPVTLGDLDPTRHKVRGQTDARSASEVRGVRRGGGGGVV